MLPRLSPTQCLNESRGMRHSCHVQRRGFWGIESRTPSSPISSDSAKRRGPRELSHRACTCPASKTESLAPHGHNFARDKMSHLAHAVFCAGAARPRDRATALAADSAPARHWFPHEGENKRGRHAGHVRVGLTSPNRVDPERQEKGRECMCARLQ